MHHIVSDGWLDRHLRAASWLALYAGVPVGPKKSQLLGDLPVQYADFARWQRQ